MIKYSALALGLMSATAIAGSTVGSMNSVPDVDAKSKQGFHGQVGLAVASMPEYVGGDDTETTALPLINVSYNDRFYFKFNRLGAWAYKGDNGFRVGGVITLHRGWESGDGELLEGEEDRDDSTMAGINAAYANGRFNSEFGYLTDISDESEGSKFYAQAGYTVLASRQYTLTLMAKVEAWDEDLTSYYYSTDDYQADSATNVTLGIIGTYKVADNWVVMGAVTAKSLDDEIADSPLVEDDTHNMALVGIAYTF